eukprot:g925.t1
MMLQRLLLAIGSVVVGGTPDALRLPSFISSDMVLQRGRATLWGWAHANATVTVTVRSSAIDGRLLHAARAVASTSGTWSTNVSQQEAVASTIVTISDGTSEIALANVAFGDVFLCSGQSNMEYPMANAFNGSAERAASSVANLRILDFADRPWPVPTGFANSSATDCPSKAPYAWAPASPATITERLAPGATPDFGAKYPSAVCFYAARELLRRNPAVPIGIIGASKSGSAIESWMPEEAMLDGTPRVYGGNGTCGGALPPPPTGTPSTRNTSTAACPKGGLAKSGAYYRGMIAPLTRMRLKAILWYQGEENDHPTNACGGPAWYRCLFPAMIAYWRRQFAAPQLPFFYVLLAAGHTAVMREAQAQGAGAIDGTAFASAVDLGAATDEFLVPGHPPRKQEVGRRLSLAMRALLYNEPGVEYLGPSVIAENVSVTVTTSSSSNNSLTTVLIPFKVGSGGHLHLNGTGGCNGPVKSLPLPAWSTDNTWATNDGVGDCCASVRGETFGRIEGTYNSPVALAESSTTSRVFHTQTFVVDAATNVLRATLRGWNAPASGIVEVRFLFDNFPKCALYSGALSGPDSYYAQAQHFGIVAQSWRGNITVKTE